jgi:hypothetical protein
VIDLWEKLRAARYAGIVTHSGKAIEMNKRVLEPRFGHPGAARPHRQFYKPECYVILWISVGLLAKLRERGPGNVSDTRELSAAT